jgi:hypothetical protein
MNRLIFWFFDPIIITGLNIRYPTWRVKLGCLNHPFEPVVIIGSKKTEYQSDFDLLGTPKKEMKNVESPRGKIRWKSR